MRKEREQGREIRSRREREGSEENEEIRDKGKTN